MRAKMLKHLHLATLFLVVYNALVFFAHSQTQSGFISLDCGYTENSTYAEASTGIVYSSDAAYVSGGEIQSVSPENRINKQQQATTLRSFPQGIRNCYTINTRKGTKYLIRATFFYGNYDGKNSTPKFDLHLGTNFMDTVTFDHPSTPVVKEAVHLPAPRNLVRVCLANTGFGTPFINALELRPLTNGTYEIPPDGALGLFARMDVGSNTSTSYRYPDDVFDRLWVPYVNPEWTRVATSETVDPQGHIELQPPNVVMHNAATPLNATAPLLLKLTPTSVNTGYYIYFHYAEVKELGADESRTFDFKVNGHVWSRNITPKYLTSNTLYSGADKPFIGELSYDFTFEKAENSTLPPIMNAIEVYVLLDVSRQETEEADVDAITNIKSTYRVERNWDGDPCFPVNYLWTGLGCSIGNSNASRITSLNLSSSGLTGEISSYIRNLNMLETLDLSNNDLTGPIPNFLIQLPNLKVLNLARNNLTGVVPAELVERSNRGSLSLNIDDLVCASSPCNKKKNKKVVVPIAASVGGLFVVLIMGAAFFIGRTKKARQAVLGKAGSNLQTKSFGTRKRHFAYSEIVKITKNFSRILGKGGFATVYHGVLNDGTEVAVKKIRIQPGNASQARSQNANRRKKDEADEQYLQFQAEVKLLLTVYHGNLTSLVGYCNQGTERVLIYEYMANGDLESHLSGKQAKVLSWETRLQISIDSAQGLEYLHSGCKPPIIHRDIKAANILITENYRAKLADFGLSKFFLTDDGTHVSTMHIAGTPGYLDPELANNGLLNEKSDVYSFGVVLLQIITSRPTASRTEQGEWTHLSEWVRFMADNGNIKSMVDERLCGDFDINSVWKVVEIAMACVSMTAIDRPNMTKVVIELRECLALEQARKSNRSSRDSSRDTITVSMTAELRPLAR